MLIFAPVHIHGHDFFLLGRTAAPTDPNDDHSIPLSTSPPYSGTSSLDFDTWKANILAGTGTNPVWRDMIMIERG